MWTNFWQLECYAACLIVKNLSATSSVNVHSQKKSCVTAYAYLCQMAVFRQELTINSQWFIVPTISHEALVYDNE